MDDSLPSRQRADQARQDDARLHEYGSLAGTINAINGDADWMIQVQTTDAIGDTVDEVCSWGCGAQRTGLALLHEQNLWQDVLMTMEEYSKCLDTTTLGFDGDNLRKVVPRILIEYRRISAVPVGRAA